MNSCVVIPARYQSSRFPGKPLAKIFEKEMVIYVAEAASKAVSKENVFVLTDDERIQNVVEKNNFNCLLTSKNHQTGTDRIFEVLDKLNYNYIINVQGDEPLIDPLDILRCIELKISNPELVINGYAQIASLDDFYSKNVPKVIIDENKHLIYMSRSPIPGFKNNLEVLKGLKRQVCIYGFNKEDIEFVGKTSKKGFLEKSEDIEILRFIEKNRKVLMFECGQRSFGVDTPSDLRKVISILNLENEKN